MYLLPVFSDFMPVPYERTLLPYVYDSSERKHQA